MHNCSSCDLYVATREGGVCNDPFQTLRAKVHEENDCSGFEPKLPDKILERHERTAKRITRVEPSELSRSADTLELTVLVSVLLDSFFYWHFEHPDIDPELRRMIERGTIHGFPVNILVDRQSGWTALATSGIYSVDLTRVLDDLGRLKAMAKRNERFGEECFERCFRFERPTLLQVLEAAAQLPHPLEAARWQECLFPCFQVPVNDPIEVRDSGRSLSPYGRYHVIDFRVERQSMTWTTRTPFVILQRISLWGRFGSD